MKAIVVLVFAGILANAVRTSDPKQVNIALETVLRFDKKESTPGFVAIDQVHSILENIKDNLYRRNNQQQKTDVNGRRSNPRELTFSDFILQAATILNEYDDDYLEDVFAVIHDESRRYINRQSGLWDFFGYSDIRRHLDEQLGKFGDVPAKNLRRHLHKAINAVENKEKTGEKNDILDIGNFLYIGAGDKFKAALKNLERLRRTKSINVDAVLRDTLKSLIFDHYSNLNDKIKRELIEMAKDYWRANSRIPGFKTIEGTRLSNKMRNKQGHENKVYPKMRQRSIEHTISVYRNKTFDNTGHVNKRYTNKIKTTENQDFTAAKTAFNEVNSNAILPTSFQMKRTKAPRIPIVKDTSSENSGRDQSYPKSRKYKAKKHRYSFETGKKRNLKGNKKSTVFIDSHKLKDYSDQSDFVVLSGGQRRVKMVDIDVKGEISSGEGSIQRKKKEDNLNTFEEADGRHQTAPLISVEKFVTGTLVSSDEDNAKSIKSTVTPADFKNMVSREGLTIESFENEPVIKKKIMRKHNGLDILGLEDPGIADVKQIINNIEKQIKDVKEEVSLVKNMSACVDKPKFRAIDSDETSTTLKAKSRFHYPDSDTIDRDNEAFYSQDIFENAVTEKGASRFAFRANDDDTTNASLIDTNENETQLVIENTTVKTTASTVPELNETKPDTTLKYVSPLNEDYIEKIENKTKGDETFNNKTKTTITDARKFIMSIAKDIKLNEIDHKNTSEPKLDVNYVLLPQSKVNMNFNTTILPNDIYID